MNVYTILALLVGAMVMFLLEICTPSFGILAGLGVLAIAGAIYIAFSLAPVFGWILTVAVLVLVPVYLALLVRVLPRTPLGRRLFLRKAAKATGTGTPEADEYEQLVGSTAVAETALRPSGAIRVAGRRIIAVAETGFIEKGQEVQIIEAGGTDVIVRKVQGPTGNA